MTARFKVEKSYEGIEAMQIRMINGDVTVYSEDDPVNAGEKGVKNQVDVANDNCIVQIDGGTLHIYVTNEREDDGIDSNGSIVINGGNIYAEGSVSGPDSALDTFRSEQGAKDFLLLKSLTSTAANAEFTAFDALHSLFQGQLAWRTE